MKRDFTGLSIVKVAQLFSNQKCILDTSSELLIGIWFPEVITDQKSLMAETQLLDMLRVKLSKCLLSCDTLLQI